MWTVTVDDKFVIACGSKAEAKVVASYFARIGCYCITRGV